MAIRLVSEPRRGYAEIGVKQSGTVTLGYPVVNSSGYAAAGAPTVDDFIGIATETVTEPGTSDGSVSVEVALYSPDDLYEIDDAATNITVADRYALFAISATGTITATSASTTAGTYCFFLQDVVSTSKARGTIRLNA